MLRLSISECGLLKKDNENEKDHCNNSGIIQQFECVECQKTRHNSKFVKIKQKEKIFVIPASVKLLSTNNTNCNFGKELQSLTEQIENQCTL